MAKEIADKNPSPVLVLSAQGKIEFANDGSWLVLEQWDAAVGDDVPEPWASVARLALEHRGTEARTLTAGFVSLQLIFVPNLTEGVVAVYGADMTPTRQVEKDLLIKAHVYDQAHEAVVVIDAELRTIDINPAYTRLTGYTEADVLGECPSFLKSAQRDVETYEEIMESLETNGSWNGELWDRIKSGEQIAIRASVTAVRFQSSQVTHYVSFITDITSHKAAQEQLYRMAHYDGLTGLPNRYLLTEQILNVISHAKRTKEQFAVMLMDLDGFKKINDTLGHRAGDKLLHIIAHRLLDSVRDSDIVARFGGDEFALLIRDLSSPNDAVIVARKLLKVISETCKIDNNEVFVTGSIGIALYPRDQTEIEPLIRKADNAMYKIKKLGKNDFHFFSDDYNEGVVRNLAFQTNLRRAIENEEIAVQYQPQVDTVTGAVLGVEALARWKDEELGQVPPMEFIPVAEEYGLIHRLGEQVLREACRQGVAWESELKLKLRMSVNVSVRQLRQRDFASTVENVLQETGFPASKLELELTETIFVENLTELVPTLERLSEMGIILSIDDFGTRYASLLYIKSLPVNRLKIDRVFVKDVPTDSSAAQIVTAIVALGQSLGCDVVAEGVESSEQLAYLREIGCRQMQGYLCSPPKNPEELGDILVTGFSEIKKRLENREIEPLE